MCLKVFSIFYVAIVINSMHCSMMLSVKLWSVVGISKRSKMLSQIIIPVLFLSCVQSLTPNLIPDLIPDLQVLGSDLIYFILLRFSLNRLWIKQFEFLKNSVEISFSGRWTLHSRWFKLRRLCIAGGTFCHRTNRSVGWITRDPSDWICDSRSNRCCHRLHIEFIWSKPSGYYKLHYHGRIF